MNDAPFLIYVTVDSRNLTLDVGKRSFDLREGNFVRIHVTSDAEVVAEQIPILDVSPSYEMTKTSAVSSE